jgi:hypothetical protein
MNLLLDLKFWQKFALLGVISLLIGGIFSWLYIGRVNTEIARLERAEQAVNFILESNDFSGAVAGHSLTGGVAIAEQGDADLA